MNKIFMLTIFLFVITSTCFGQDGWLSGTAAYVDEKSIEILDEAPNIIITLKRKHQNVFVKTDSLGDYYNTPLRPGKYCLVSAKNDKGVNLKFSPKQIRCFRIKADKDLRFDIMILKAEE